MSRLDTQSTPDLRNSNARRLPNGLVAFRPKNTLSFLADYPAPTSLVPAGAEDKISSLQSRLAQLQAAEMQHNSEQKKVELTQNIELTIAGLSKLAGYIQTVTSVKASIGQLRTSTNSDVKKDAIFLYDEAKRYLVVLETAVVTLTQQKSALQQTLANV